jgi:phage terminase Nu1 subunit (DNA packaging protein)
MPILKTTKQLAAYFKISPQSVRVWRRKGMPITEAGEYDTEAIQIWRRHSSGTAVGEIDLREAKRRKAVCDSDLAKLRLERERGSLVSRQSVLEAWTSTLNALLSQLGDIGPRLAPRIAGETSEAKIIAAFDAELRAVVETVERQTRKLKIETPVEDAH